MAITTALALAAAALGMAEPAWRCRCLPGDACWDALDWAELNRSVSGRLLRYTDMVEECVRDSTTAKCGTVLRDALGDGAVDNHFLSGHPGGLQHTGHFAAWNISHDHSEYIVRAETESDVVAAVRFAHEHRLRLAVKNTGHDWYGRSTAAGSLMLWTHNRKNMTWHDAFSSPGTDDEPVPAVTVESGVEFYDLYPAAQNRGRLVIGGTCDSVGAAGCWLSGCYGVFSKKFGAGAVNMLEARVVLANGSLVVASKASHPDLFWSLRGGGGGVAGVVTQFTVRTHPAPKWMTSAAFSGNTTSREHYTTLLRAGLKALANVSNDADNACNGGAGFGSSVEVGADGSVKPVYVFDLMIQGYNSDVERQVAYVKPLVDLARSLPGGRGGVVTSTWRESEWDPEHPAAPWWSDAAGDKAASTVSMMTRFVPLTHIETDAGRAALADGWAEITDELPDGETVGVMIPKGQAGLPASLRREFDETALNPVILNTAGTILQMTQLPWFEEVTASSTVIKALWPRMTQAVGKFTDWRPHNITRLCEAGAAGDEAAAVACLDVWQRELVPAYQRRADRVRETLRRTLPNVDREDRPFSGAYWSETDYFEQDFQLSYWGAEKYKRLLKIKFAYDPEGLFVCRHCAGSEFWTEESGLNCRNETAWPHRFSA